MAIGLSGIVRLNGGTPEERVNRAMLDIYTKRLSVNQVAWNSVKSLYLFGTAADEKRPTGKKRLDAGIYVGLSTEEVLVVDAMNIQSYIFFCSEQLEQLTIGFMEVRETDLCGLPKELKRLSLNGTHISSLRRVELPNNLQGLYLNYTQLTSLSGVSLPDSLQELYLSKTPLKSLRGMRLPRSLRGLDLSGTLIMNLSGVRFPENLRKLYLSGSPLMNLNDVELPSNLQELYLARTRITSLSGIELPDNLHELHVSDTVLSDLSGLKLPEKLRELYLSGTALEKLNGVKFPDSLKRLSLSRTPLKDLYGVNLPVNLQRLDLDRTSIRCIPDSLRNLKKLQVLNLSYTNLEELPDWMTELGLPFVRYLRKNSICLDSTTVKGVDMSIFDRSQEEILQWFKERKNQGESPLNEIKVVFLGNGDVGKSHTIARLMRDGREPDASFTGESTPGIAIENKEYDIDGQKIQVHFWDFGGQEILYSMHRMFLTDRTIYVVMVDARNESRSGQAREWLDTVKSFAGSAPVLLAVNKLDQNPGATLDERELTREYPNLEKIIYLSALKATREEFGGIFTDALLELIRESDVPRMKWPRNWKRVKDALQDMEQPYIFSRDYERICRSCDVDNGAESLLNWCNDLGVCFRREDRRLKDYVILRPEWITNAVYTILFNKRDSVQNGLISLEDMFDILTSEESRRVLRDVPYSWQDMTYILDVVRKFSLSYPVDHQREFFPMLCSENSSPVAQEYEDAPDALEFHMEFDYLPNNVLHRLMVERHRELDPDHVWLTGARFRQRDTGLSAVVKIDGKRLKLHVRSGNALHAPNTYLSIMAGSVDRIRHELKLPKTTKRLVYKVGDKRAVFDYERLLKMHARRMETEYSEELDDVFRIVDILNQVAPAETAEQERLVADLVKLCADMQADSHYWGTKENTRNTYLRNGLEHMEYFVKDQTLRGIGGGEDAEGELDLDIRRYKDIPWTICEALRVRGVERAVWSRHLDKLLDNYNPNGLRFLVLVTYVDDVDDRFDAIWNGFKTHIQSNNSGAFLVEKDSFKHYTTEDWAQNHYIQTARCRYVRGGYMPTVYHIFVRMGR